MALSRRVRIFLWIALSLLVAAGVTIVIVVKRFEPTAHDYVVAVLRRRYKSDVQLGRLQISLFPSVKATADNLSLRMEGRTDLPPMIVIRQFRVEADFLDFFRYPKRIRKVTLDGLELHLPPKGSRPPTSGNGGKPDEPFVLEEVVADGTRLEILPSDPQKDPLVFTIRQLNLRSVGKQRPMTFRAVLDNAKPPGLIRSEGKFGPWAQDEPGDTPLEGKYTFADADLSVFKGIRGILSSTGDYRGQLGRIEVHGKTDVPDFALTLASNPMHLRTDFQATVDGTNGNTVLHPVHAILDDSAFDVSGAIERGSLEKHKEINLESSTKGTDLQDFLRLAIKGPQPPMRGKIAYQAKVKIPPGKTTVVERLQLNGTFNLTGVKFTNATVQGKIASLSHHAQGEPKETEASSVTAHFAGQFQLRDAILKLPRLKFDVPGADVSLSGQYGLKSGEIDFQGTARLDATVSQMTTGIKHVLLKPVDPLFRRDGAGTVVPMKISGTRGSPSFKLDIGRVLTRK